MNFPELKLWALISRLSNRAGCRQIYSCKRLQLNQPITILVIGSLSLSSHINDCTQEWTFEPDSFDYVHTRWLVGSIADWPRLFKEAYRCLKPGGYLESHEALSRIDCDDGSITEKSAMH